VTVAEDAVATEFECRVDTTLQLCCELARALIGAHHAAMSLIVAGALRGLLAVPIVGETA
jgi:hypothetical protein